MIPKLIHYCWFGGESPPPMYRRCIESWHDILTDYQIVCWDERNCQFDNAFLKDAVRRKQWAFVSDFIRMRVIHEYGGIYLDSDVEIIKDLSPLLANSCFIGYEAKDVANTGVIGCIAGHIFPKKCMNIIEARFIEKKPYLIAPEVANLALMEMDDVMIYPREYFYPYNPYDPSRDIKNLMYKDITTNTYAVHHWGKSWKMGFLEKVYKKLVG